MTQTDDTHNVSKPGLFGRIRAWFFTGLLVTAPVLLTVYITWAAIKLIDSQVSKLLPGFETSILGNVPGIGPGIQVVPAAGPGAFTLDAVRPVTLGRKVVSYETVDMLPSRLLNPFQSHFTNQLVACIPPGECWRGPQ